MYCPGCKSLTSDGAQFCPKCGIALPKRPSAGSGTNTAGGSRVINSQMKVQRRQAQPVQRPAQTDFSPASLPDSMVPPAQPTYPSPQPPQPAYPAPQPPQPAPVVAPVPQPEATQQRVAPHRLERLGTLAGASWLKPTTIALDALLIVLITFIPLFGVANSALAAYAQDAGASLQWSIPAAGLTILRNFVPMMRQAIEGFRRFGLPVDESAVVQLQALGIGLLALWAANVGCLGYDLYCRVTDKTSKVPGYLVVTVTLILLFMAIFVVIFRIAQSAGIDTQILDIAKSARALTLPGYWITLVVSIAATVLNFVASRT